MSNGFYMLVIHYEDCLADFASRLVIIMQTSLRKQIRLGTMQRVFIKHLYSLVSSASSKYIYCCNVHDLLPETR
jgi:hypothetical protein